MNDSIPQRIIIETVDKGGFWTLDNPLWIVMSGLLTVIITAVLSYYFTYLLKKREYKNIGNQLIMERSIAAHQRIFNIKNKSVSIVILQTNKSYYSSFESKSDWDKWFLELWNYYLENYVFLSREVCLSICKFGIVNKLIKHLERAEGAKFDLLSFGTLHYVEIQLLMNELDEKIGDYFEMGISKEYKFPTRSQSDFDISYQEMNQLSIIRETVGNSKILKA